MREEGAGHREPLVHAMGVGAHPSPAHIGETHRLQALPCPFQGAAPPESVQAGEEHEVLEPRHSEIEGAVAGGNDPEETAGAAVGEVLGETAEDLDLTRVGIHETGQHAQQGRLSRPIRAEQRVHLLLPYLKRNPGQGSGGAEAP